MPLGHFYLCVKSKLKISRLHYIVTYCDSINIKRCSMDIITIDNYDFIKVKIGNAVMVFSTAKNKLDFSISSQEGKENLKKIEKWFNVKEVGYLKQIHSDKVFVYDKIIHEGDGLITNAQNTAIGIFNADCVPILIFDIKNKAIGAIHSGWKGTINKIANRAVEKMHLEYNTRPEDLKVYIGPHNRGCCYEVGDEVSKLFLKDEIYNNIKIIDDNKLNLEACIVKQLNSMGVKKENINSLGICTYCNNYLYLHSYRKNRNSYGRMFSFIYIEK